MKKNPVYLFIIVVLISGCSFNVDVINPPATATPRMPSPGPTFPSVTPEVGFTPKPSGALFYSAYFTLGKDDFPGRYTFPVGTKQIFAHWQFQNMRNGMLIRREWFLNGEPWLTREESWDESRYGVAGLMPDISIYDLDAGLPSGRYELRLYIDGVIQPIGAAVEGQPETWAQFEILPDDSATGIPSPDGKWTLYLSNGTGLYIQDASGSRKELYGGVHIVSRAWMPDSRHILFVDQNPNGTPIGPAGSLPGTLLSLDTRTLDARILYSSETVLAEAGGGLIVSPDGKFAAALEGTGYGDACFLDSRLIFFEIAENYQSATIIRQEQFGGLPAAGNGVMYVTAVGGWDNDTQFTIPMKGTCNMDLSTAGAYVFDLPGRTAARQAGTQPAVAGDLGWGEIHGTVLDAVTGRAIPNAIVSCQQSSYTSPSPCAGSVVTSALGLFVFEKVYFHDTDTITLTVTAPGYQPQEYSRNSFTMNDMLVNFLLAPLP